VRNPPSPHPQSDRRPNDERLFAYVLGLEEDPELVAAATRDEELRGRIEALRADLGRVTADVAGTVPETPPDYTDLATARWQRLREAIREAPASADEPEATATQGRATRGTRRAAWRWVRVLAPAAAVLALLVVGVGVLQESRQLSATEQQADGAYDKALGATESGPSSPARTITTPPTSEESADAWFDTVIVARPLAARDDAQAFDVVRTLRGSADAIVRLHVVTSAADPKRLYAIFLRTLPITGEAEAGSRAAAEAASAPLTILLTSEVPATDDSSSETAGPGPARSSAASPGAAASAPSTVALAFGEDDRIVFENGISAIAVQLPAGVQAGQVALP